MALGWRWTPGRFVPANHRPLRASATGHRRNRSPPRKSHSLHHSAVALEGKYLKHVSVKLNGILVEFKKKHINTILINNELSKLTNKKAAKPAEPLLLAAWFLNPQAMSAPLEPWKLGSNLSLLDVKF